MTEADIVIVFKALADETRLKIVQMLSDGELCACSILEHFHITQPTLSYHMRILCESGLVDGRKDGAWMRYTLNGNYLQEVKKKIDNLSKTSSTEHYECACKGE